MRPPHTAHLGRRTVAVLVSLLALLAVLAPAGSAAPGREWGTVSAADKVLRQQCRVYPYRYRLTVPQGDWSMEAFLSTPRGRQVASDYRVSDYDPARGYGAFHVCGHNLPTGRYTIRTFVVVKNGPSDGERWLVPAHFRFRRP